MKKIIKICIVLSVLSMMLIGCTGKEEATPKEEKKTIHVISPAGLPTLSLIKLFHDHPIIKEGVEFNYESIKTTDLLTSKLVSNEADIALIPTNLGAKLYNKGVEYQLVSSNIWGNLYIISNEEIKNWQDLKGKEISMIGKGLTPDILFRYLLEKNGLDAQKDITIHYMGGATELAPAFISGKTNISIMPEPMLSKVLSKKKDAKIVMDLQKEWSNATGLDSSYPQASLFVKSSLIKEDQGLVKDFLKEYEDAMNWTNENPQEAMMYAKDLKLELDENINQMDMKRFNMKFVKAKDAKQSIEEYLNVLLSRGEDTIGGKLPDENFYYEGK